MIRVRITPDMLAHAESRLGKCRYSPDRTAKYGQDIYGFLGEEIFHVVYPEAAWVNTPDCDFIHNDRRVDVKTVATSREPRLTFEGNVPRCQYGQKTDDYAFARVHYNKTVGWLIAQMPKDKYMDIAVLRREGEVHCEMTVLADMYCVEYRKMNVFRRQGE
jgi:hypothetical protein